MNFTFLLVITFFGIGYLPISGTCASICIWYIYDNYYITFYTTYLISLIGWFAVYLWKKNNIHIHDPSFIVIDEICGYIFGYEILRYFFLTQYSLYFLLLFRFFDITKPCGIIKIDSLNNVFGIMGDDYLATIFAIAVMKLFLIVCFF